MTSHISMLRDFLTGFHKRKVAKKEEAKKKAQDREKQERLEARREVCSLLLSWILFRVSQNLYRSARCWQNKLLRTLSKSRRLTEKLLPAKVSCLTAISEFIVANRVIATI